MARGLNKKYLKNSALCLCPRYFPSAASAKMVEVCARLVVWKLTRSFCPSLGLREKLSIALSTGLNGLEGEWFFTPLSFSSPFSGINFLRHFLYVFFVILCHKFLYYGKFLGVFWFSFSMKFLVIVSLFLKRRFFYGILGSILSVIFVFF